METVMLSTIPNKRHK